MKTAPEEGVYWDPLTRKHVVVLVFDAYELSQQAPDIAAEPAQLHAWAAEALALDRNTVWVGERHED